MRLRLHLRSAIALAVLAVAAWRPAPARAEAALAAAAAAAPGQDDLEALIELHRRYLSPAQLDAFRRSLRGVARRAQGTTATDDQGTDDATHGGGGNGGNGGGANGNMGGGHGNGGNGNGGMMNGNTNGGGNGNGMMNGNSNANGGHSNSNGGNGNGMGGGMMTNGTNGNGMTNGNGNGMHFGGGGGGYNNRTGMEWGDYNRTMMNGSDWFCWAGGSGDYGDMMGDFEDWWSEHANETFQCDYGDGSNWIAGPVFNLSDLLSGSGWEGPDAFNVSHDDDNWDGQNMHNMSGNQMNGNSGWGWSHGSNSSLGQEDWNWTDMSVPLQELMMNWTSMIGMGGNHTFRCRLGNETIWQDGQMMFNMSYPNGHGGGWRQGMNFSSHQGFQNGMMSGTGWGVGNMMNQSGRGSGYANCDGLTIEERSHIMILFQNAGSIQRSVTPIVNGIEATTTSSNPDVALVIQQHVAEMSQNRLVRGWDPVFFELHEQHDNIQFDVTNISDGVFVVHTGDNPCAADTATAHSSVVTAFLENGMQEMMKRHDAPSSCADSAVINSGGSSELTDSSAMSLGSTICYTVVGLVVAYFAMLQ